ncbi:MAG: alpha/beta hydrolase [Desulfobacterales bacterium]|nr:alpha/beta hydrolase [Desulfobacterales bacterium]MBF0395777.1 alpha/beta hydrolase [Desulfobacterales bacterium]
MKSKIKLDKSIRDNLPGHFIEIEDGIVHYHISREGSGEWIVLVHGLVTPMFVWKPLADDLAAAGFRVLMYDLFGRGYSDRPELKYSPELYIRQLQGMLTGLNIDKKVNLVGWSMGGAICSLFADRYQDRVNKLAMIAPALFVEISLMENIFIYSHLFSWFMHQFGESILLHALKKHFYQPTHFPDYFEKVKDQMQYQGFIESFISTVRYFPMGAGKRLRTFCKNDLPVLVIWGKEDTITPCMDIGTLSKFFANCKLFIVDNAGHAPHYEYRAIVNDKLISFFKN